MGRFSRCWRWWISIICSLLPVIDGQHSAEHQHQQQPPPPIFGGPKQNFRFGQTDYYYQDRANLYPFGAGTRDSKLADRSAQTGHMVDLFKLFPYYGARYNYSIISIHGYITFGELLEDGLDFLMGDVVRDWPSHSDPATIAVYACRQKEADSLPAEQRGVHYRLAFRESIRHQVSPNKLSSNEYVDPFADSFLDQLQHDLRDGMVGAQNFHADVALVVTWENMTFSQASREDQQTQRSTYQAVFMTDLEAVLSYVILNYHTLGYAGADISGQAKRGRCRAQFNGGNRTGVVQVDPVHSKYPLQLAMMSAVPHRVRGRYLFRVDNIVRRGGCSNMTAGTYRMTIYPDIVNSMGDVNIQLNAKCLTTRDEPVLQIAEYKPSRCVVKNAAIAECKMVRYFHWGTKNVYLQVGQNKAYVGSVYYVPPGQDPFQLDIGPPSKWFDRNRPQTHTIKWHPDNFTNERGERLSSLRLALWGYKERRDEGGRTFVPVLKKIALISSAVPNVPELLETGLARFQFQQAQSSLQWLENGEREFGTYRFGFLRLYAENPTEPSGEGGGLWSAPIPLHFWWGPTEWDVERASTEKCLDWYHEDGRQWNFIMDTETNSSCPCRLEQAQLDLGRFMPHPRCSQRMRNMGCDAFTGAKECFLSAQNVQGHYVTHYGQVCCYDRDGYLMQTSYQSVVQAENYPYSPGFPQRAYEFGTYPFTKQFEIPVLSNYYHDVMPYFFCCKWISGHCQFLYWRRPSSGCQNYQPPGVATLMGAGHFITVDGLKYIFNEPGTYVFLHKPQFKSSSSWDQNNQNQNHYSDLPAQVYPESPEVLIEVRLERYPNRLVDFSHPGMSQSNLVQPLNVSVVTGVALQEGSVKECDRVVFVLGKDTRRKKYRLNVLINDELRYFDHVVRQKFRGVFIYTNDWKEGQSEIYAALERSRIGVRVRESYAVVIADKIDFQESYGLLDVMVSIPSEYRMTPSHLEANTWQISIAGLVGTFSHNQQDEFVDPTTRRSIGTSSAAGASEAVAQFARMWKIDNIRFPDLFTLISQDHETWPESAYLGPVYPFSSAASNDNPFVPQYEHTYQQSYAHCLLLLSSAGGRNSYRDTAYCPESSTMEHIEQICLQMPECRYEYFQTKQSVLAEQLKQQWTGYNQAKAYGTQKYNSCGAINIEYPEYLVIGPSTGKLYLEGDTVRFDCSQDHWVKGSVLFQCREGGWTKGAQPWCRSKQMEHTQKIMAIVFGILCFTLLLLGVFLCFLCMRRSNRRASTSGRRFKKNAKRSLKEVPPLPAGLKMDLYPSEKGDIPSNGWEDSQGKTSLVVNSSGGGGGSARTTPVTPDQQFTYQYTPPPMLKGKKTAV